MKHWGKWLGGLFFIAVCWLLADRLAEMKWEDVWHSLRETPWYIVLTAFGLTAISYSIFCFFDRMGLSSVEKNPRSRYAWPAAFICYASNFNLGSIVGGLGMRVKLYTDLGVSKRGVARVVTLSTASNWIGYALFAGIFFLITPPDFTDAYGLGNVPWRWLGVLCLFCVIGYLWVMKSMDNFLLFGHTIPLPSWREGLLRLGLAILNWASVSALLAVIFSWHMGAPVSLVVSAYLVAAVAGLVAHIPGGLGVFETIFLAALGSQIGDAQTIAGLLAFRALYYLSPLALAAVTMVWLKSVMLTQDDTCRSDSVRGGSLT